MPTLARRTQYLSLETGDEGEGIVVPNVLLYQLMILSALFHPAQISSVTSKNEKTNTCLLFHRLMHFSFKIKGVRSYQCDKGVLLS